MYYSDIHNYDVANGPGIRVTIFASGCRGPFKGCKIKHCSECFNGVAWKFDNGKEFTDETLESIMQMMSFQYITGLTLLGGEPMEPENQQGLLTLVTEARKRFPEKDIWLFTGMLLDKDIFEMYDNNVTTKKLLDQIDVIVDGPFLLPFKDASLIFKGSRNQRTIDLQKSLKTRNIELLDKYNDNLLPNDIIYDIYENYMKENDSDDKPSKIDYSKYKNYIIK